MGFEVLIISIGSAMDKQGTMTTIIEVLPPFLQKLIKTQIGEVAFPGLPAFAFKHPATMGVAIAYVVFLARIRGESCVADVVTLCCVFGVCTGMAFVRFDRRDI
jgi:hypothetical protein